MEAQPTAPKPDIVLIHGLWLTGRSWEGWKARFESRGHTVHAPSWPGMEADVEDLNAHPEAIAEIDIEHVVDHYDAIIRELDAPPIIMGHSFGGAFTQILLDRGLGLSGVGVAAATVKGVPDLPLSTLRATVPVFKNPFSHKAVPLDEDQFRYGFTNTLEPEESVEVYHRYHVPAASKVLKEGAFANLHRHPPTEVDFEREGRAPLLFIAFEQDHIVPPKATRHNAEKYKSGVIAYKEFEGRPHFPAAPGWEQVADYALDWAMNPVAGGL